MKIKKTFVRESGGASFSLSGFSIEETYEDSVKVLFDFLNSNGWNRE